MRPRGQFVGDEDEMPSGGKSRVFSILEAADNFNPPNRLDPREDYKNCVHCASRFRFNRFHCRMCGHMYCSDCVEKYFLPEKFRDDPSQSKPLSVCLTCRNACYRFILKVLHPGVSVQDIPLLPHRSRMIRSRDSQRTVWIHPCDWAPDGSYDICFSCDSSVKKKSYHCRVCGELYCSNCTVKMNKSIPITFKRKGRTGAVRVCKDCRFHMYQGVRLTGNSPPEDFIIPSDYWQDVDDQFDKRKGTTDHTIILERFKSLSSIEEQHQPQPKRLLSQYSSSKQTVSSFSTASFSKPLLSSIQEMNLQLIQLQSIDDPNEEETLEVETGCSLSELYRQALSSGTLTHGVEFYFGDLRIPTSHWKAVGVCLMGSPLLYKYNR